MRPFFDQFKFKVFDAMVIKIIWYLCGTVDNVGKFVGL